MTGEDFRATPEALLELARKEETTKQRGKLKIFFGMAAGVGKTYAMLSEARQLLDDDADVVIGILETHGRIETIARAEGIPFIPRKEIQSTREDGESFTQHEMDLDSILRRKPAIVLVDELAHTNAPGSYHPKRYMDVEDLLEGGIHVYTTLNVQHLESVADFVEQITGAAVQERVPDRILDLANEIELIDISPDELRKRLHEGKVYRSDRAEVAARNFFKPENLLALREMALQTTARVVDTESLKRRTSGEVLRTRERILVLVGTDRFAARLIRIGRRMAADLKAPWFVMHVRSSHSRGEDNSRIESEFNLARSLGAEVLLMDGDLVDAVEQVIAERSITQMLVGRTEHRFSFSRPITHRLIDRVRNADIHIVPIKREINARKRRSYRLPELRSPFKEYAVASGVIWTLTVGCLVAFPDGQYSTPSIIFIAAIAALGLVFGRGPVLSAAVQSAFAWDFLFIPPRYTLTIGKLEDRLMFGLFFAVAIVTGILTSRLRRSKADLLRRQRDLVQIQEISQALAGATGVEEITGLVCNKLSAIFDIPDCMILLKQGKISTMLPATASIDAKEQAVADWVVENGKPAGKGTDTLPLSAALWIPLKTPSRGTMGALRLPVENPDINELNLVGAIAAQASLALERELLASSARQAAVNEESEKLFHAILRSISHELRSPVTAMLAAAENLSRDRVMMDDLLRNEVRQEISDSSQRLARVVDQLLAMSRIESGRLTLQLENHDLRDLLQECMAQLGKEFAGHTVKIDASEKVEARFDFPMMRQALIGVLHNAALH
ncbi:MAG TPA: DUF4118 domain-containing protein, partial [Leptospiraceae bacterium]|nr:DUF4118 domain-containing protein [Leptospiraceae bacterium]